MGCAPSAPELADTLPIKAQLRTAFSRTSTADHTPCSRQTTDKQLGQQPNTEAHDVVLCYPLGGTTFGLELQARYEKLNSLSLWSPEHLVSVPGTPAFSMAPQDCTSPRPPRLTAPGLEIKPAPESAEAPSALSTPAQLLSSEVQMCRRGVVVLLTTGCTWDDGVLGCLRLAGKFLRPLVMVHCVQSCPLPALEEWPPDVRPIIAAAGSPVKYLAQHSTEALRDVEARMLTAAAAPIPSTREGSAASASATTPSPPSALPPRGGLACPNKEPPPPPAPKARQPQQQPAAALPGAVTGPDADDTEAPAEGPCPGQEAGPGPLSLAALHASDGAISRRAAELLQSWTCALGRESSGSSSPAGGGAGTSSATTSRTESVVTSTLVEPLMLTQRASPGLQQHGVEGSSTAASGEGAIGTGNRSTCSDPSSGKGARSKGSTPAVCLVGKSGSSSGRLRCVLRYLDDDAWATPVAFVCAQLEQELGPGNVSLQPVGVAAGLLLSQEQPRARGATAVVAAAAAAAAAGCDGGDGGGGGGTLSMHGWTQAQQRQGEGQGGSSPSSGTAATAALQAASRSGGSGSGDRVSGSDGSACQPTGLFGTASTGTTTSGGDGVSVTVVGSCGLERTATDCEEDDQAAYSTTARAISLQELQGQKRPWGILKPSGCSSGSSISSGGTQQCTATPRLSAGHEAGTNKARTSSWTGAEVERQGQRAGVVDGDTDAVLVYFVSPGVSAPGACLTGVAGGLAAGRRVVLVVDGECCQRLPNVAPREVTSEAWKVVKKVWSERILYVPDYHTSFCALLKQRIVPAAASVIEPCCR